MGIRTSFCINNTYAQVKVNGLFATCLALRVPDLTSWSEEWNDTVISRQCFSLDAAEVLDIADRMWSELNYKLNMTADRTNANTMMNIALDLKTAYALRSWAQENPRGELHFG